MDTTPPPPNGRPWLGPAVSIAVGALAAVILNVGIGRVVSVPMVEDEAPTASAPRSKEPATGASADEEPTTATTSAGRRLSEQEYLQSILGRNLFDPSQIGVEAEAEAESGGEEATRLDVELTGTIVSDPASYSAAFIVESGKSSAWAYGIGQKVQGAEIVEILEDRVRLKVNGRDEWLMMGGKKKERTISAPANRREVEDQEKIAQTGDNQFELERSLVDKQLEDLDGLAKMGRALLHRGPDGQYDGYRLSAIRRGSLPDQMGIRNGDIIHSINGIEMNSLEGAMEAYEKLRNEGNLQVEITRRGKPEKLNYNIK